MVAAYILEQSLGNLLGSSVCWKLALNPANRVLGMPVRKQAEKCMSGQSALESKILGLWQKFFQQSKQMS